MPYIKDSDRARLAGEELPLALSPGELNYLITCLCRRYWEAGGNYQAINDILGALEGAKLEFYRRVAAGYEDGKIQANGDVY